jgi:CDP-diacylglycerol--glycerol-3-phosphate 3-phosphatidyltransferase
VPSIYTLKPRFQALLRPAVKRLAESGVTANQITISACALSIASGAVITLRREFLILLPAVLFIRMALNAIDGMLAREFGQKSALGAYLNELTDVISDASLYLPFARIPGFDPIWIGAVIVLAVISEMAGVLGLTVGGSRRYDGPMGKSDRAFFFGALAFAIGFGGGRFPAWASWGFPILIALAIVHTIVNRVRNGLAEAGARRIDSMRS